jgi:SAM-dependent methyltransferase
MEGMAMDPAPDGMKRSASPPDEYERTRLRPLEARVDVWRAIAEHLARWYPSPCDTVVDLGCGYGDFINQISAPNRIGVDARECRSHLAEGVSFVRDDAGAALASMEAGSVDLVMASNLLEHLDWDDVGPLLKEMQRVVRPGGRAMFLQPNFRYCSRSYFDDYTHRTIFTDRSLAAWIRSAGLEPVVSRPRFLPFTMDSKLPTTYWLTRLYLSTGSPVLGAQMLVVAERR